ncbi:MAG TPA: transglycosylase SLT domain-containing protein [Pyrinomonadaceae bacterium]|jgi:membrane-bound lytic murein transglycosylase D|nr:transglycosylase SLT domain-containing protein [Pyrinomonadaceae bacterium]
MDFVIKLVNSHLFLKGIEKPMTTSRPTLVARITLFGVLVVLPAAVFGQIPAGGSSARNIPTEVEKSAPRVAQIIKKAEDSFRKGKLNLEAGKRSEARDDFDQAVDEILTSGIDVRASHELQTYYLELVERIYREEVPTIAPSKQGSVIELVADNGQNQAAPPPVQQVGFVDQRFEPSPLDELSKLVLTSAEEQVSADDVAALEQAQHNINFAFNPHPLIQQYINYYQGRGRSTMESGLRRSGVYMKMARQIFKEEGVPVDVTWLGQVESAWKPKAMSWAAASGLWQFVPGTGRQFGLRQTAWIDERNSFEQSTRASAKYLKSLASRYNGNWELAMAAYNTGAGNVDRGIARAGTANFWAIYPYIAQETRNYVPNILATILIAKNPEKYGFKGIKPDAAMAYDVVQVASSTSLQLVAEATDSSVDYIRSLNPELKRDVTPKGEAYNVRIPGGKGKQFVALLKRIPADRRETARIISIAPGEDLQAVANRTSTSVAQLQALNSGVDLKSTNKLVVPNSNVRLTINRRKPATAEVVAPTLTRIRARKGDTIAKIAAARNLDANEVARINGVTPGVELQAGQEIRLPATAAAAPSRRR